MARPATRSSTSRAPFPPRSRGVDRRSILRGSIGAAALLGVPTLLSACGGDEPATSGSGAASAKAGPVKFGINEAKGSGPAYERLQGMADAYTKKTGATVSVNAVDHNTFQESINTYLQGTPDDVFTWFAGYRMAQFADNGLISDVSDVWPIDGMSDAFKKSATAPDGKQYFVPIELLPLGGLLPQVGLREERLGRAEVDGRAHRAHEGHAGEEAGPLRLRGQGRLGPRWAPSTSSTCGSTATTSTWSLCQGKQKWDSAEVKNVFTTWKDKLHPVTSRTTPSVARGRRPPPPWPKGESGMYLLGTFVVDSVPTETQDDLDFFTFPALDQTIGSDALDAPIDGFCIAAAAEAQDAAKAYIAWLGTPEAADAGNNAGSAPFIAANSGASAAKYGALQKKSVEFVSKAKSIAQFLDRDTNADLANTVITASLQAFLKNPDDIDCLTTSIQAAGEDHLRQTRRREWRTIGDRATLEPRLT